MRVTTKGSRQQNPPSPSKHLKAYVGSIVRLGTNCSVLLPYN
jgi:hypothetical protein